VIGQLGGHGDQCALDLGGTVLTYAELDAAIERSPQVAVCDASALPVLEALICVYAAARRGTAVIVEDPAARPERSEIDPSSFLLVATSGSSGRPRPLARTVASWFDSFPEFTAITGIEAHDRVLITGPLHATMHLFGAVHALWQGACVTDDPTDATVVHAVPAVLRRIVYEAPRLRTAIVAGTMLDDGARAAASGIEIVEYYGAAELSIVAARRVPDPMRLLDSVDAEIRDGLLYVRSPYRVLGAAEWFGVGDRAVLGANRELTILGRGEFAINVGGTTVMAEDVERTLETVDGVTGAAVIGSPHSVLGETITAVIEHDDAVTLHAIRAQARALLAREAMPSRWITVDELPRTGSGKVARGRVKELHS
jgi:acyl-CoA synthetase (AMP-forming)/AMP-acid ligase II